MNEKIKKVDKNYFIINGCIVLIYILYLLSYCIKSIYLVQTYISGILLFFLYSYIFLYTNSIKTNRKSYLFVYLVILHITIGAAFTKCGIGSYFNIINMFWVILFADKFVISKKVVNIFKIITPLLYFAFIISNHSFLNPNFIGYIFLLYFMLLNILFDLSNRKPLNFLINILLAFITIYYGNVYQCRTSQIITILIVGMEYIIVNRKIFSLKILKKLLPYILTIGSLLFTIIYVYMWKKNISINLSAFAEKRIFSGRNLIWNECIELIKTNPIFGVGSKYTIDSHATYALHNSMLMLTTTFGIPCIVYFIFGFKRFISSLYEKYSNKKNFYLIIISLCCIFFVDYFESYFYWSMYSFIDLIIILLSIYRNAGEINEK